MNLDYRGGIEAPLTNHGRKTVTIAPGARVAPGTGGSGATGMSDAALRQAVGGEA